MTAIEAAGPGPGPGLGARIRGVRLDRGLSTRELARRVGCSASLISQIERGISAPSVGVLYLLANELTTSLDYLFGVEAAPPGSAEPAADEHAPAPPGGAAARSEADGFAAIRQPAGHSFDRAQPHQDRPGQPGAVVQRADSRRCIELAGGVRWERLTPDSDPFVDFLQVVYEAHGGHADQRALRHDGREYGLVLTGRLQANVGFDTYDLGPGDSIAFDCSSPHAYRNETDEPVEAIWFIVHHEPWRA